MKKILFIGGSLNQTKMMHKISIYLNQYDCYFTPFYADGYLEFFRKLNLLEFTILGGNFKKQTEEYFHNHNLKVDYRGLENDYDLIYTCQDVILPRNLNGKRVILIQEGMTDPENLMYYLVKWFKFPRYLASTSTTGLSHQYDYFCVASEGYKQLFLKKGVKPSKIHVTGIPNFDNAEKYRDNEFPHRGYVLVATSDSRETFKYENRKKFILNAVRIADGKQIIFKLHPNENFARAEKEIEKYAPGSIVFRNGNINHMVANCDILITMYSSVVYIGLALGKDVYSFFDRNMLKSLLPIQNGGTSALRIANLGRQLIDMPWQKVFDIQHYYELKEAINY